MAKRTKAQKREELLAVLRKCAENGDIEVAHLEADEALISFIDDAEVSEVWEQIARWYA